METYFLMFSVLSSLVLAYMLLDITTAIKLRSPTQSKLIHLLEIVTLAVFVIPYFIISHLNTRD